MNNEIRWLVCLGIDHRLFTLAQAVAVSESVGDGAQLTDFAQKLIDDGIVGDAELESLEKLAGLAVVKARTGPPAADPFAPVDEPVEPPAKPVAPIRLRSATMHPFATMNPFGAAEAFAFEKVADLNDEALAKALKGLLISTGQQGASDLHMSAGARPFIRKQRVLAPISEHVLTPDEALRLNTALLAPHQRKVFLERKDFDYALALDSTHRYRVNLMFHKNGAAGAYRMVPAKLPELDDLGLRNLEVIRKLLSYHNGLILVTGPVGAGKTTTLAALVNELNVKREDHVITVEDPIEVVQPAKGCNITQREVGPHTKSFATALKGALREDPDVIVIGELRDLETIEMAISASETGHLVIGTMHTSDASTTLNRLLDVFPPAQQTQMRSSVAESLRGVICQRLLPGIDGNLVLACEILVSNPAVGNLIKEGKTQGLRNVMETGVKEGMCLMDNVVFDLHQQRKISAETALQNITNRVLRAKIT
ncbi:MAG TPA: PilT/PilU family type 4a pilus ATPase [Opitutaceae bacterium]